MGEERERFGPGGAQTARSERTSRTRTAAGGDHPITDAARVRKKSVDLVRERPAVKFAAIADWVESEGYDVEFLCEQLGVSRSGYYAWRRRPESSRATRDHALSALIVSIHQRLRGNPGVRRVHAELASLGQRLSAKRVWRLMRAAGLQGRHPRAWRRTTIHGDQPVSAPHLIGRNFSADRCDQRWCGDIT